MSQGIEQVTVKLKDTSKKVYTTLQSMMNAKLSLHGFWHCCQEKGNQDDTPQPISEFQVGLPLLWKRLILVYPNT